MDDYHNDHNEQQQQQQQQINQPSISNLITISNHNCQNYYHYYGSISTTTITLPTTTTTLTTVSSTTTRTIPLQTSHSSSSLSSTSSFLPLVPLLSSMNDQDHHHHHRSRSFCQQHQRFKNLDSRLNDDNLATAKTFRKMKRTNHRLNSFISNNNDDDYQQEFMPSITNTLEYCNNNILPFYQFLLKLLGWQSFRFGCLDNYNCFRIALNATYLSLIIVLIMIGHLLQYQSCLQHNDQDQDNNKLISMIFDDKNHLMLPLNNNSESIEIYNLTKILIKHLEYRNRFTLFDQDNLLSLNCFCNCCSWSYLSSTKSSLTNFIIKCSILLISYLILIKQLRFCEIDRFQNICVLNLLLSTKIIGNHKANLKIQKIVKNWMRIILLCLSFAILLFIICFFIVKDDHNENQVSLIYEYCLNITNQWKIIGLKISFLIILSFIELILIAIIIIYALYCQMNILFIQMNVTAIREKCINFQEFAKNTEIFKMNMNFLNNRYSLSVSLLMIYITTKVSVTIFNLFKKYSIEWYLLLLTICSLIYWMILLSIPLLQAARLTNSCQSIIDIGHELCARPFCYQQTARDDLDSLLTYTTSLNLKAKLLMIPVRPSFIISIFLLLIFIILILSQLHLIDL